MWVIFSGNDDYVVWYWYTNTLTHANTHADNRNQIQYPHATVAILDFMSIDLLTLRVNGRSGRVHQKAYISQQFERGNFVIYYDPVKKNQK